MCNICLFQTQLSKKLIILNFSFQIFQLVADWLFILFLGVVQILSVYHVVVIIPTTPENYYRRMVVRATWGNQKYLEDNPFTFSFLFAVGLPPTDEAADVIEVEQRWYQDIVVGNFVGQYAMIWKYQVRFTYNLKLETDAIKPVKFYLGFLCSNRAKQKVYKDKPTTRDDPYYHLGNFLLYLYGHESHSKILTKILLR